ncbi:hypothetical protein SEA_PIPPA_45 [Arthrobacter phage Pippa]|nr:hypothetical protein SEA_PIPPA_45 [Arthrobacter phage Pippa]
MSTLDELPERKQDEIMQEAQRLTTQACGYQSMPWVTRLVREVVEATVERVTAE